MTEQVPATAGAEADARRRQRREGNTLLAAMLTNGPNELIDFVLPLWAGAAIGLSATEVGVLLAVEMVLSMVFRPVSGVLADTFERRYVAAAGAALYGVSAAGYALAQSAPVAYAAAAVGGVGGALLWVSVRAIVSERLAEDSAVFPRLLSSQETGAWVAFIAGLTLIGLIDYTGVFLACAAACAAAAVLLLVSPSRPGRPRAGTDQGTAEGTAAAGLGAVGRRLRPMLLAVVLTMTAESAVSLLLLLHLQRGFDLEIGEIAYVFLPGAIVMSVAAEHLHRYVVRFGRSRVLMAASLSSAGFAVGLAWAPNPFVIAGLWILSGLAWAAVIPIGQAVIAEASGEQAGRGMGVYESARLLGALTGSLAAGVLYDSADWTAACLVAAVPLLAGAVVVPRAVRRLGVADVPPPAPEPPGRPEKPQGPAAADGASGAESRTETDTRTAAAKREPRRKENQREEKRKQKQKTPRQIRRELGLHAALFAVAQLVLLVAGLSWMKDLLTGDFGELLLSGGREQDSPVTGLLYGAGRLWTFILIADALWQGGRLLVLALRPSSPEPPSRPSGD
ncbi:MFS transporter [Streptomyces xinghaiensis]|uniref:MFS transporter n=1 Tax=Streptomyces xinghaiensis TaxID=1038928 RepID=UPI000316C958|nr:MFS transporter [Streptomyces xinghaiensis]MZE78076.1 MFS transporter [Streptomyces sp. SID5475]